MAIMAEAICLLKVAMKQVEDLEVTLWQILEMPDPWMGPPTSAPWRPQQTMTPLSNGAGFGGVRVMKLWSWGKQGHLQWLPMRIAPSSLAPI